jgi:hypothetical protein
MGGARALAAPPVVPPAVQQFRAENLLLGLGQIDRRRRGGAAGDHLLQQRRQLGPQGREQLIQPHLADIGLKGLGQHLPGAARHRLGGSQLAGLPAAQVDQLAQGRREG